MTRGIPVSTFAAAVLVLAACQATPEPESGAAPPDGGTALVGGENGRFEAHMKEALLAASEAPAPLRLEVTADASPAAEPAGGGEEGVPFSTTNLQERGVDEADLVKSDGRHLYAIRPPRLAIDDPPVTIRPVMPEPVAEADDAGGAGKVRATTITPVPVSHPAAITVHSIQSDPADSRLLSTIEMDLPGGRFDALYLLSGGTAGEARLAALGGVDTAWGWGRWSDPWSWNGGQVHLWGFDVSDPVRPERSYKAVIDGYLIASRRIGDTLYLVTRHTPLPQGFQPYPADDAQRRSNEELVARVELSELLPTITLDDGDAEPLVHPGRCFMPPRPVREQEAGQAAWRPLPSLITVTAIDLRDPRRRDALCYLGETSGFYVSPESLYLIRAVYGSGDVGLPVEGEPVAPPPVAPGPVAGERTLIHKFDFTAGAVRYAASGHVPGTVRGSHPAFLMSERDGLLRIVTSSGWGMRIRHRLAILAQEGERLVELAALPNRERPEPIGKPGERIHGVRFIGDKAYLVTFRQIDPLYVIDLSEPADPRIAGELEVPGFSDYLHPVGDTHLLGVGRDVSADGRSIGGVKFSLYDISDMSAPKEVGSVVVGEAGSYTPLQNDHKALAFLRGSDDWPDRFAVPLSVTAATSPDARPVWQYTGLHLFEIDDDGLRHQGMVIGAREGSSYADRSPYGDRAVIQGGAVHYVRAGHVLSADWAAVTAAP